MKLRFGSKEANCNLVIFDESGTVTDLQSTWIPTIRKRIGLLTLRYGEGIRDQLFSTIGLKASGGEADLSGPLMVLEDDDLIFVLAMVLYENGVPWARAIESVKDCYRVADQEVDRIKLVRLLPGIDATLRKLKRSGVSLAIVTMGVRSETQLKLRKLGILDLFDSIVAAEDMGKHKRDPEVIFKVCNALDIPPERTAVVGDTPADLSMGKRAGVAVSVALSANPTAEIKSIADAIIASCSEITVLEEN